MTTIPRVSPSAISEYRASVASTGVIKNINNFGENRFLSRLQPGDFIFEDEGPTAMGFLVYESLNEGRLFIAREEALVSDGTLTDQYIQIIDEHIPLPDLPSADRTVITEETLFRSFDGGSARYSLTFKFYSKKLSRMVDLYGKGSLSFPPLFSPAEAQIANDIEAQSVIPNNTISYSSLSSLGEPVLEDFSISSEAGILTVETVEQAEVYEDVGGVTSFARGVPEDDAVDATGARGTRTVDGDTASVYRGY